MTDYHNRVKKDYGVVRLPSDYTPEDRGIESCCCKFVVWGSAETDLHKRMKNSWWIRDVDTWRFYLVKHSTGEEIELDAQTPVREPSARYSTVDWTEILLAHGADCYTFSVDYDIAGITGTSTKGEFQLFPFDLYRFREYVMMRTVLGSLQSDKNINFRDSNIVDCIAFKGKFSNANPNTQVENIIYSDRVNKNVIRENLYEYELNTNPLQECLTRPLLDLHFLYETEVYISDFNPDNHRQYLSLPCIFKSVEPPVENGIFATIKAGFGDKKNNNRSRYGV